MAKRREMDLINGSLGDKIVMFALPLAATGILQQFFNAADIAVVGRFAGKHAMAAVGSNAPIVGLMINLFIGISMGTNVVIARFTGEGNKENIRKSVHTAIVLAVAGGLVMGLLGELLTVPLLRLMGVPAEIYDMAVLYMRVYLVGMPVILLYNFESAIFRSQGDTRTPLMCLTISGIVNVILNVFFVVVLGMTVNGVALATVIANLVSSSLLFYFLCRTESAVHVDFRELKIHPDVLIHMLQIGVPAGLQSMVFSLANICVQSAINSLGADVVAGSSAAFNIASQFIRPGLYDLCRPELRSGKARAVQENPAALSDPGLHCGCRRGSPDSVFRHADPGYFQYGPGSGKVWDDPHALYPWSPSLFCFCGSVFRRHARIRLLNLASSHVPVRNLRNPHHLGLHGLPCIPDILHSHDGLPGQHSCHRRGGHSLVLLPAAHKAAETCTLSRFDRKRQKKTEKR